MIGSTHEQDLISLLERLHDTTGSQGVMVLLIYGLRSGTGLVGRYAEPLSRSDGYVVSQLRSRLNVGLNYHSLPTNVCRSLELTDKLSPQYIQQHIRNG